jgi:nucleotide-binding universal stress UspA family protein
MFKKILVPTDGSPISEKSAKAAIEFAAATKASIVALSVAQLYPYMLMPEAGAMLDLSSYEQAQDQAAQSNADKLKTLAESAKVGCEIIVKRGVHPYEESTGTVIDKSISRVAPPSTISLNRVWPYPPITTNSIV